MLLSKMIAKSDSCSEQDFQEYLFIKESSWHWSVFICTVNVVLSIFAVSGNAIILITLYRCRCIHSSTKALFYSLSFSDFGVGMVAQPLQVASGLGTLLSDLNLFCSIQPFYAVVAYFFCSVSFLTMTVISMDRYFALYFRMRYRAVVTVKKVSLTLVLVWLGSISWAFSRMWHIRINKISGIIAGFVSIAVTLSCYFKIYWTLKQLNTRIASHAAPRSQKRLKRNTLNLLQYRQSVNSMMCVFGLLILCYIPYFCSLLVVASLGYNASVVLATNLTSLVIFLNSSLNPFVYCWRIKEIRLRVISMARQICPKFATITFNKQTSR